MHQPKTVLVLGANSDVAKEMLRIYVQRGDFVIAASRNTAEIEAYALRKNISTAQINLRYWDAVDFESHRPFYESLPAKPQIIVYAAGFQVHQDQAMVDWKGAYQMMNVHYAGAVSMLNLITMDTNNDSLEQIIGLSSLSGVRGRKSNFVYGSTKAAFSTYLAGLRQHLAPRKVKVNAIVAGYIRSKMTAGLVLPEALILEPSFVARAAVHSGSKRTVVPGWKWKIIYRILKWLPETLVSKLP